MPEPEISRHMSAKKGPKRKPEHEGSIHEIFLRESSSFAGILEKLTIEAEIAPPPAPVGTAVAGALAMSFDSDLMKAKLKKMRHIMTA